MNTKTTSVILLSSILSAFTVFGQDAADREAAAEQQATPDYVQELREGIESVREALHNSRQSMLASLEDATDEERSEAIANWREAHAEQIELLREFTAEVRESAGELRGDRGQPERAQRQGRPERAERGERGNVMRDRANLGETMRDSSLTPEERRAEIEAFRAQQQALVEEHREARRDMRERNPNARGGAAGGRGAN